MKVSASIVRVAKQLEWAATNPVQALRSPPAQDFERQRGLRNIEEFNRRRNEWRSDALPPYGTFPPLPLSPTAPPSESQATDPAGQPMIDGDAEATKKLLKVFTDGVVDQRIAQAAAILQSDSLTTNQKLERIDGAMPFPATASAETLGDLLGVSKQAVGKTEWWSRNRKGEKADEIGRRQRGYEARSQSRTMRETVQDD